MAVQAILFNPKDIKFSNSRVISGFRGLKNNQIINNLRQTIKSQHLINHCFRKTEVKMCCICGTYNDLFFFRGQVNESCNLIGSLPFIIFLSLPTGHGNAFVSRRVHLNFRCHFS